MQFVRTSGARLTFPAVAIGLAGSLLLSGCASQTTAPPPTTAELCASLKDVVAQSETRFRKFKTTPTISPFSGMTKWETRPVFPDSQCDVLEWVGGRTNYACTWPDGSEAEARATYEKNAGLIAGCLTAPWSKAETRGQTGGATTFTQRGKSTQVVMRYFKPRGGFMPTWETSLTIGDEITSEPR
ncbi:hypothetical protein [Methylotetracoccus oryzae]|uniref:hypothetical protein n=1 Tax=Methylotetracoccus oryzae TaxID=1919059 RepID=UPI001118E9D6|nr:hypothetical protein [Methylotetracoccus oryzae]